MSSKRASKRLQNLPADQEEEPTERPKRTLGPNKRSLEAFSKNQGPVDRPLINKRSKSKNKLRKEPTANPPPAASQSVIDLSSTIDPSTPRTLDSSPMAHRARNRPVEPEFDPEVVGDRPHKVNLQVKVVVDDKERVGNLLNFWVDINNISQNDLGYIRTIVRKRYLDSFEANRNLCGSSRCIEEPLLVGFYTYIYY